MPPRPPRRRPGRAVLLVGAVALVLVCALALAVLALAPGGQAGRSAGGVATTAGQVAGVSDATAPPATAAPPTAPPPTAASASGAGGSGLQAPASLAGLPRNHDPGLEGDLAHLRDVYASILEGEIVTAAYGSGEPLPEAILLALRTPVIMGSESEAFRRGLIGGMNASNGQGLHLSDFRAYQRDGVTVRCTRASVPGSGRTLALCYFVDGHTFAQVLGTDPPARTADLLAAFHRWLQR